MRSLVWSQVLSSKQPKSSEKSIEKNLNIDTESVNKPTETTSTQGASKQDLKIILPDIKEEEIKAGDVKIVLENIKEQSLGKEVTATDALKQVKEKILDSKSKEGEQEKGIVHIFLHQLYTGLFMMDGADDYA